MKRLLVACLLAVLAAPAFAVIGTVDDVPAATLLLPYFEVDLADPSGVTTLMSINNASATAVLAHVVLWTDLSVHILDFNVYLTGYDVQSINLRDIIVNGNLPVTASAGQDPTRHHQPPGPGVAGHQLRQLQRHPAVRQPGPLGRLHRPRSAHADRSGLRRTSASAAPAVAIDHGDDIARGYVTVDTVITCNTHVPQRARLLRSRWLPRPTRTSSGATTSTSTRARTSPRARRWFTSRRMRRSTAANYTFYYRYSALNGLPGADKREGLGNVFAVRYLNGGGFDGGTSLLTWRDAKRHITPFNCALNFPAPFPLGQNQVVVFDEEENFETPDGCTISPCPPKRGSSPSRSKRSARRSAVRLCRPALTSAGSSSTSTAWSPARSVPYEPLMQNWVSVVMDAEGRYSVGFDAMQLGNVTDPVTAPDPFILN